MTFLPSPTVTIAPSSTIIVDPPTTILESSTATVSSRSIDCVTLPIERINGDAVPLE